MFHINLDEPWLHVHMVLALSCPQVWASQFLVVPQHYTVSGPIFLQGPPADVRDAQESISKRSTLISEPQCRTYNDMRPVCRHLSVIYVCVCVHVFWSAFGFRAPHSFSGCCALILHNYSSFWLSASSRRYINNGCDSTALRAHFL